MKFSKEIEFDKLYDLANQAHKNPHQFNKMTKIKKQNPISQNVFKTGTFGNKYPSDNEDETPNPKQIFNTATFGDNRQPQEK